MITIPSHPLAATIQRPSNLRHGERGAALAIALLMLVLMSALALGILALVQGESRIAGSDLKRTEACYAAAASIEMMTNDFSTLFAHTSRPTANQLKTIEDELPTTVEIPGFTFPTADHKLEVNAKAVAAMGTNKTVTIPNGPFNGLIAGLKPYTMRTTAQSSMAQCTLQRDMNNYLIPLFQFGMFSDKDIELHPGPDFTFNGRVHANGNIYVNGSVKFLAKVTTANEFIYDKLRNNNVRTGATVSMQVGAINVAINKGSMTGGPFLATATASPAGQRGYFPDSPSGTINASWDSTSVAAAVSGVANKFGGQLLTRTTGAAQLKLPLQLDGNPTRELIKRMMPNDSPDPDYRPSALSDSRYHSKAQIRILIDDEVPSTTDASGIPAGLGVLLSTFDPVPLPLGVTTMTDTRTTNDGGRALWKVLDNNTAATNSYDLTNVIVRQQQQILTGSTRQAETVRGVRPVPASKTITSVAKANGSAISITSAAHGFTSGDFVVISGVGGSSTPITAANNTTSNTYWPITVSGVNAFSLNGSSNSSVGTTWTGSASVYKLAKTATNGTVIPYGAGLTGRILIQVVDADGITKDVTQDILSMGVTEGEPNSIIQLQRPLWASFTQGSRDASVLGGNNNLTYILNSPMGADGEILTSSTQPLMNSSGYLTNIIDDGAQRSDTPPSNSTSSLMSYATGKWDPWNAIVPINTYNVREGHLKSSMAQNNVYERGITNIVQLNMRNVARWLDGVYDKNLLVGSNAVTANIGHPDGFTVYVSDRRGDRVKSMVDSSGATIDSTNGMVDNVDIYGPNGTMDAGEDVQAKGTTVGASLGNATTAPYLKDTRELPDPVNLTGTSGSSTTNRILRAISVAAWQNLDPANLTNHNYFRSAVRLFNGDNLQVLGSPGPLTTTHGITVSSENMVYIWGNYNTLGINKAPPAGTSSLNETTSSYRYCPSAGSGTACPAPTADTQVPASIVADAIFPLSRTWFDSVSALYPDDYRDRPADSNLPGGTAGEQAETSVRAGVIAGNNLSAMEATGSQPDADNGNDSRLSGGMHNFPRFLEDWNGGRWNFVGSFVPLYHSTQGLGQWWYIQSTGLSLYGAPERNWAFDTTFLNPDRLPPGTPMFQYISPTAFRQVL